MHKPFIIALFVGSAVLGSVSIVGCGSKDAEDEKIPEARVTVPEGAPAPAAPGGEGAADPGTTPGGMTLPPPPPDGG